MGKVKKVPIKVNLLTVRKAVKHKTLIKLYVSDTQLLWS